MASSFISQHHVMEIYDELHVPSHQPSSINRTWYLGYRRQGFQSNQTETLDSNFATNSLSLQHSVVNLRHFKLWFLLDQIIEIWNIKGLY